jgi:hypothetical protein
MSPNDTRLLSPARSRPRAVAVRPVRNFGRISGECAPGQPRAVLAREQARLLPRLTLGDADFGPPIWDRGYELAPAGVLTDRQLVVEVVSVDGGQTAIRVDAQVGWQPPRRPARYLRVNTPRSK